MPEQITSRVDYSDGNDDCITVTPDGLMRALTGYHLNIGGHGNEISGPVTDPLRVARELWERLECYQPGYAPVDPEVEAIAVMHAALEPLGQPARERAITWLACRHGVDIEI